MIFAHILSNGPPGCDPRMIGLGLTVWLVPRPRLEVSGWEVRSGCPFRSVAPVSACLMNGSQIVEQGGGKAGRGASVVSNVSRYSCTLDQAQFRSSRAGHSPGQSGSRTQPRQALSLEVFPGHAPLYKDHQRDK